MNHSGPGLYRGVVLSFDPITKDIYALVYQLQGSVPLLCQAWLNFRKDLQYIKDPGAGRNILVFFDGGELDTKPYWMLANAGVIYADRAEITHIIAEETATEKIGADEIDANSIVATTITGISVSEGPPGGSFAVGNL